MTPTQHELTASRS